MQFVFLLITSIDLDAIFIALLAKHYTIKFFIGCNVSIINQRFAFSPG